LFTTGIICKLLNSNQMSMQSFKIFPGVDIVN
jgi:hypothetical protein